MKAIVLTYDKYHPFTDHMIQSYQMHWPSNPFVFRIPYQNCPQFLKDKYGPKIELWESPSEIKKTVLSLLSDLDDNEWIYWCIDDKYLVSIDIDRVNKIYHLVMESAEPHVDGILFCRCRGLLHNHNLRHGSEILTPTGEVLVERRNYFQFWIHQFMRVKILRNLFEEFPDRPFTAIEMDAYTGQRADRTVKPFEDHEIMYVTKNNLVRFGESTTGGRITRNCLSSFKNYGIDVPNGFDVTNDIMYMGKLTLFSIIKNLFKKLL